MKRISAAIGALLILALGACESLPIHGRRSVTSMKVDKANTAATLFIWSNDVNAGIVTHDMEICMQRAMTARGMSASAGAQAPEAILNFSKAAAAAAENTSSDTAALEISAAIAQSVTALSTTSERTAFLDIGMFYLCQLAANDTITEADTVKLTLQLFTSAAGMAPAGTVPRVDAPSVEREGSSSQ